MLFCVSLNFTNWNSGVGSCEGRETLTHSWTLDPHEHTHVSQRTDCIPWQIPQISAALIMTHTGNTHAHSHPHPPSRNIAIGSVLVEECGCSSASWLSDNTHIYLITSCCGGCLCLNWNSRACVCVCVNQCCCNQAWLINVSPRWSVTE